MALSFDEWLAEQRRNALEHHGIKGMHWGVRKKEEPSGNYTPVKGAPEVDVQAHMSKQYAEFAKKAHEDLASKGVNSEALRQKYGPPAPTSEHKGLSDTQKKLIALGVGVAVIGGVAYYANKKGALDYDPLAGIKGESRALWETRMNVYNKAANDGLNMHWEKGVDLPAGHVFDRVSSVAEKEIRPGGFFAAFDQEDINRYKAILPTFWPQWGVGSPEAGGFVNHYKAKVPIKAPSGKETFGIFKDVFEKDPWFKMGLGVDPTRKQSFSDDEIKKLFTAHSQLWCLQDNPNVNAFFKEVKARGYNALIDFNDAGALSKTPMRLLDGSHFEIAGNDALKLPDMLAAAKDVSAALVHIYQELLSPRGGSMPLSFEETLAHYGVKGMHWGVRKSDSSSGSSNRGPIRRGATKAAVALDAGAHVIKEGEKKLIFLPQKNRADAAHRTQAQVLVKAAALNRSPEFKGKDLKRNPDLKQSYYNQIVEHAKKTYADELGIARTEAWGDFFGVDMRPATNQMRFNIARDKLAHADGGDTETLLEMDFETDDLGHIVNVTVPPEYLVHEDSTEEDFFMHYGVKGMHWGIHKEATALGVPHGTARLAKKDAEEFTKAKMFYGQGAGTRRKLINAKVAQRASKDPAYKKAFDHFLNQTDLAKRADQARGERRRKDAAATTAKTVRGVKNTLLNNGAPVTAAALAIGTGAKYLHDTGKDKQLATQGKKIVSDLFKNVKHEDDSESLEHYGVKGMHWGVRRNPGPDGRVPVGETRVTQPEPGKKVRAVGGKGIPAHEDAIKSAHAKQIAKASTTDALSTKQLQDLVQRMNLEQQYSRLVAQSTPPTAAQKGQKFIKDLLGLGKTYNEVMNFQNSPGGKQLSDALNKKKAA